MCFFGSLYGVTPPSAAWEDWTLTISQCWAHGKSATAVTTYRSAQSTVRACLQFGCACSKIV
eukprot:2374561-Amphidinium_carterae.1